MLVLGCKKKCEGKKKGKKCVRQKDDIGMWLLSEEIIIVKKNTQNHPGIDERGKEESGGSRIKKGKRN